MSGGGLVEGIWGKEVKKGSKGGYGHISSDTYEIPKNKEKSYGVYVIDPTIN